MTTNTVKHTPGPWAYGWETQDHDWAIVTDASGSIVANVNTESGPDVHSVPAMRQMPAEHNARLIAAAPDLLAAAMKQEEADRFREEGNDVAAMLAYADSLKLRRAAISKATGSAPAPQEKG